MSTAIRKAIEFVKDEIEWYDNPGAYQDSMYYVRCEGKVAALEDVLSRLVSLEQEEQENGKAEEN